MSGAQREYGVVAKTLHWVIVALLVLQYLVGWLMPDVHRGPPGRPMTLHVSVGMLILLLIALRFVWRLAHPIPPESALPHWQRIASEGFHWLLYLLVFATTITGWFFVTMREWSIALFNVLPLPLLTSADAARTIGRLHETMEWALLIAIGLHVAAAFAHLFIYKDRVMQRMLPW